MSEAAEAEEGVETEVEAEEVAEFVLPEEYALYFSEESLLCGKVRKSWMESESDGPECNLPLGHVGSHKERNPVQITRPMEE